MPSRDENGKRIAGNAQRARKAEREAPDPPARKRAPVKRVAKKKALDPDPDPESSSTDAGWFEGPNPFDQLGDPPDDTAKLITWGAKIHAMGVVDIAQHPNAYPSRREWIRALLDKTTQLGVIRDKSAEQEKIDRALHRDDVKGKKQGLSDVRGKKAPQVTRPTG